MDVFTILSEGNYAYVNYLRVLNGTIADTKTVTLEKKLEETDEEVLAYAIAYLREAFKSLAREIIVPIEIEYPEEGMLPSSVPKGGDKKKLLDLSDKERELFQGGTVPQKKILQLEGKSDMERKKVLYQLQADLELQDTAHYISNVSITLTSREAIRYPPVWCLKKAWPPKRITAILISRR